MDLERDQIFVESIVLLTVFSRGTMMRAFHYTSDSK
jgi:hypothetical protein